MIANSSNVETLVQELQVKCENIKVLYFSELKKRSSHIVYLLILYFNLQLSKPFQSQLVEHCLQ